MHRVQTHTDKSSTNQARATLPHSMHLENAGQDSKAVVHTIRADGGALGVAELLGFANAEDSYQINKCATFCCCASGVRMNVNSCVALN